MKVKMFCACHFIYAIFNLIRRKNREKYGTDPKGASSNPVQIHSFQKHKLQFKV